MPVRLEKLYSTISRSFLLHDELVVNFVYHMRASLEFLIDPLCSIKIVLPGLC